MRNLHYQYTGQALGNASSLAGSQTNRRLMRSVAHNLNLAVCSGIKIEIVLESALIMT